jgi:hypothetical protein
LDRDSLPVDSTEIRILKQRDKIRFNSLLQGTDRRRLESQVRLEVLCDFTDETLEGEFTDEKLG